jgi:hypothetical protein
MLCKSIEVAATLIQIIYEEKHREHLYPFADPYFNKNLTVFFENSVISEVVQKAKSDKISVCSWKLREKLRWYIGRPRPLTQELLESDYEVMSFTRNTDQHNMMDAAEIWHKGFLKAFDCMMEHIGEKRPIKVKNPIYQNHFSAQTTIYKDYVTNYLNVAIKAIENDKGLNSMAMADSRYTQLPRESSEHLKDKIGINYYPLVPFLLERLFSVYCQNKGIKVSYL